MKLVMKNVLAICLLMGLFAPKAFTQVELKINPIGILFNNPDVAAEFLIAENFGVEGKVGVRWYKVNDGFDEYKANGFNIIGSGKYYFKPDQGCDKFYIGAYLKFGNSTADASNSDDSFSNTRLALGPIIGYKWVASSGKVVFELGFGVGRAFVNDWGDANDSFLDDVPLLDIDFTGTLAVGYRFGVE